MKSVIGWLWTRARAALERRLLGVTAEEIRYTFADVRGEIRANRTELMREIARLHDEIERVAAREEQQRARAKPVAEA